jgi:hypothetical protein
MRLWLSKNTGHCWDHLTSSIFEILNETLRPADPCVASLQPMFHVALVAQSITRCSYYALFVVIQFEGLLCVLCVLCVVLEPCPSAAAWSVSFPLGPGAFLCVHLPSLYRLFFSLLSSRWIGILLLCIHHKIPSSWWLLFSPAHNFKSSFSGHFWCVCVCVCVFSLNCERKSDKQHVLLVPVIFLTEKGPQTESCENFNTFFLKAVNEPSSRQKRHFCSI